MDDETLTLHLAAVADLPTGLGIEWSLIHEEADLTLFVATLRMDDA